MILVTNGDGIRGDFSSAFKKAVDDQKNIVFAQLDPTANPKAAARFDAGPRPLLIGWYCGETVVRRSRPWGSDLPLAIEQLNTYIAEVNPTAAEVDETDEAETEQPKQVVVDTKPVTVTDQTFQKEVIDYPLPVLVDYWAEWCGPCRMVAPILDKLAKEYAGKIRIAKVNVDENPGLSSTFRIQSIPTMMMLKNRTIVFSQPGALPENALRDLIEQLIKLEVPAPEPETKQ
ncbi:MAG: thioredoxin [Anaerolineae bacterium]|nr:thioredoxin [Anaerolineae bacterium]